MRYTPDKKQIQSAQTTHCMAASLKKKVILQSWQTVSFCFVCQSIDQGFFGNFKTIKIGLPSMSSTCPRNPVLLHVKYCECNLMFFPTIREQFIKQIRTLMLKVNAVLMLTLRTISTCWSDSIITMNIHYLHIITAIVIMDLG